MGNGVLFCSREPHARQPAPMSLESVMSSMGKSRDLDGSIDRVADPPTKLWPILAAFLHKCNVENIHLETIFEEGGGNHFGVMKTSNFFSSLKQGFPRYDIKEEIYNDLMAHYGVGYKDPRGRFNKIGWMDFCEDVRRSEAEDNKYGVKGVAECLHDAGRGDLLRLAGGRRRPDPRRAAEPRRRRGGVRRPLE